MRRGRAKGRRLVGGRRGRAKERRRGPSTWGDSRGRHRHRGSRSLGGGMGSWGGGG